MEIVLNAVFAAGAEIAPVDADELEEDYGAEEAYDVKLGRWIRQTLRSVGDVAFWQVLYIKSLTRAPLTGMHFWLQKHSTDVDCILDLVVWKIADVYLDFSEMLKSSSLVNTWKPLLGLARDVEEEAEILAEVVSHAIDTAGDFHRRFVVWKDTFPRRLVNFIAAAPDEHSDGRKETAQALLELTEEEARMDDLTHKFRTCLLYTSPSPRDRSLS
eukprot:8026102-Pyramimonas_sp.AAC.1